MRERISSGTWPVRWLPVLLIMAVIFAFSSVPADQMIQFAGFWDLIMKKGGHLWVYALLGAFIFWALVPLKIDRPALTAWGLAVLYAFSDELHQYFVPGRGATLVDVGIDAVGAAIGIFVIQAVISKNGDSGS